MEINSEPEVLTTDVDRQLLRQALGLDTKIGSGTTITWQVMNRGFDHPNEWIPAQFIAVFSGHANEWTVIDDRGIRSTWSKATMTNKLSSELITDLRVAVAWKLVR